MTSTLLYRQLPSMMSTFNQGPSFLHQKRAHSPPPSSSSFSTRDANDSSSSDSDTPPPPRKRRTTATSSEEEGKPSLFAFQPPAARSSRRGKRAHDSEEDDDRIGEDEEDISLENQAQESSPSSGTNWRSSAAAFPPNPKRIKRSLAEHLTSLGISEGAAAAAGGRRGSEEEEEVLHPYTVEHPEEVGPGVWLGSAPASQEDEVEISGVGEDEEERARNEMAVGFWRGNGERQVPSRDPSTLYLPPSYLNKPTTHHLPPPSEAWLNQQRGVVLYAPPPSFNAPFPNSTNTTSISSTPPLDFGYLPRRPFYGSRTSSNGEMQLDTDDEASRGESPYSEEELWPGASITELPDEDVMDNAGEMDVD